MLSQLVKQDMQEISVKISDTRKLEELFLLAFKNANS